MIQKNNVFTMPSLSNVLDYHADTVSSLLNCHHLGTIQSFDPVKQTATATIDYQKVSYVYDERTGLDSTVLNPYPILTDCPVRFECGVGGGVTVPVQKGDKCWISFNDRSMDGWFKGTINQAPEQAGLHSFTDAIISVGPNPPVYALPVFDGTRPALRNGKGTAFVAVAQGDDGKIQAKNSNQNLATILQSILTHLQNLSGAIASLTVPVTTAPGTSGPPLNAATFTSIQSDLAQDASNLGELLE